VRSRLLEPEILFPGAYLLFLTLALASFHIPSTARFLAGPLGEPGLSSYLVSILGIVLFSFSARKGKRAEFKLSPTALLPLVGVLSFFSLQVAFPEALPLNLLAGVAFALFLKYFSMCIGNYRILALGSFLIALTASLLILASQLPLLSPQARMEVAVSPQRAAFHGFGMLAAVLLVAFFRRRHSVPLLLGLAFLGLLSGFKSDAVSIIIAALLTGLFTERFGTREALGALISVAGILTLASTLIARVSYGVWHLSPLAYPFYRAGFTFSLFDRIVQVSLPLGVTHGEALVLAQRNLPLSSPSIPHVTSTLFGPPVLDFGIPGLVATSLLLGYYLGALRGLGATKFSKALYAMALTHLLLLIEVGLQPTSLVFLGFLLYLSLREREIGQGF